MRRFLRYLVALIVIIIVAVGGFIFLRNMNLLVTDEVMASIFEVPPFEAIEFETLVLKESPNQHLVCDPEVCAATPHQANPQYDMAIDELSTHWVEMAARRPALTLVHVDEVAMQFDYIARTRVMQYPDLITVRFVDLGEGRSTLYVYSRAVYGYGDGGVNAARISDLLAELE